MRSTIGGVVLLVLLVTTGWAREVQTGRPTNAFLGVLVGPAERNEPGVLVREVTPDSPAAKGGLKNGDRVIKFEGQDVQNVEHFLQTIAAHKSGDKVTLQVVRGGQEQNIPVTLGERPATQELQPSGMPQWPGLAGGRRPAFLGVQTQPLTPELKQRLHVQSDAGVVVTEVVSNSPAGRAGFRPDDVITALDGAAIHDPGQLREAIQHAGPGKEVTLQVARGNENLTLKAQLGEASFGQYLLPGNEQFPSVDVGSMIDQGRRIRELERRVEELERRVRELEKKQPPPSR
jgi:S1-C subfamily serine protease